MNSTNQSCPAVVGLRRYQSQVYLVGYSLILLPGLLSNVLAIWVFSVHLKETKKAIVYMMNLAVADLLQVLSLPLRIYYYTTYSWPFGHAVCMMCFYLKYVNMYTSIFFLCCISVRRCQLTRNPLTFNPSQQTDIWVSVLGWSIICIVSMGFPLLRRPPSSLSDGGASPPVPVCFSEMSMKAVSPVVTALLVCVELLGFVLPLVVVVGCTCMTTSSLREAPRVVVCNGGVKQRALRMVLICAAVFLLCFVPFHVTMALQFLVEAGLLMDCGLRRRVLRWHPVTVCLASFNSILDPILYYFTTNEFWRKLKRSDQSRVSSRGEEPKADKQSSLESAN